MQIESRKSVAIVSLVSILLFSIATSNVLTVQAQPSLSISFYKNNGYGWGNDINGIFTMNTETSDDVAYIEFYLDGNLLGNCTEAPFKWRFDTNDYELGLHTLKAVAYDAQGNNATSQVERNFVEPQTGLLTVIIAVSVGVPIVCA